MSCKELSLRVSRGFSRRHAAIGETPSRRVVAEPPGNPEVDLGREEVLPVL